jgi:hypothetical protein
MKLKASLFIATFGLFLLSGCGEGGEEKAVSTMTKVDYHAVINSRGVLKITHKDSSGQLIVEEEYTAKSVGDKWSKHYEFDGPVDALLTLELADSSPPDPVGVEFYIALNGERVQKATKFLTKSKGMTLSVTRP